MGTAFKKFKYFESQEDDENVLIITRKHWFYLLTPFIIGGFFSIISTILFILLKKTGSDSFIYLLPEIILSISILFFITYPYTSWVLRYYNVVILTDEHIVEVEQIGLFSRKVSVLDLDQVEDVTFGQHGIIQTTLDYGNLEIQTAGELRNFIFNNINDPDGLQRKIMELKELEENERRTRGKKIAKSD